MYACMQECKLIGVCVTVRVTMLGKLFVIFREDRKESIDFLN